MADDTIAAGTATLSEHDMERCQCGHQRWWHDAHMILDPAVIGLCSSYDCSCKEFTSG